MIESIKTNLIEENLYGADINNSLRNISASEALFNALKPLYDTFCRKKNQDKLTESFYGLIPQSCEYLNCKDYQVANLVMINIPDHLVGFYRMNQTKEQTLQATSTSNWLELDPAERGPLSYVAGYVVSKLHKTSWRKKNNRNEEMLSLLQSLRSPQDSNAFISARTRGGLITPCDDLVGILEIAEMLFRKEVMNIQSDESTLIMNIPTENICNSTMNSSKVKSLWENILLSAGVEQSSSTHMLCLENIIKLYLKVRSFSYARDYITKYKIKNKQLKNKALRKDMKKGSKV